MLAVYLTNTEIQALSGSVRRKKYRIQKIWRQELPPDVCRNGEITDAALLKDAVAAFWKENKLPKSANLVVNASRFVLKTMDAPKLPARKLRAYIAREYSELERSSQSAFTCFTLSSDARKRQIHLMAAAGERVYLLNIMEIFEAAGVKIAAADSSLGCSIRVLNSLPALKEKTCIVQLLESGSLTSLLFVNGEYVYSTTNRMTAAPDTFAFGVALARIVSSIVQFCKEQDADDAVTHIFLGGFTADGMEVCIESIAQMDPTLEVAAITGGAMPASSAEAFHELVPVVGGLSMPQGVQLLRDLHSRDEKGRETQKTGRMLLPAAAALLVFGSISAVLLAKRSRLEDQLAELNDRLRNPTLIAAGEEYDQYRKEIEKLNQMLFDAETAISYIESYPLPTGEVAEVFCRCADGLATISISGYDAASGVFSLSVSTENAAAVNQFVERLRREKAFSAVSYTGYSYQEQAEQWIVQVICTLAADAGR